MADETKPLTAAERRRQRILQGSGDRLSKITNVYTEGPGGAVPSGLKPEPVVPSVVSAASTSTSTPTTPVQAKPASPAKRAPSPSKAAAAASPADGLRNRKPEPKKTPQQPQQQQQQQAAPGIPADLLAAFQAALTGGDGPLPALPASAGNARNFPDPGFAPAVTAANAPPAPAPLPPKPAGLTASSVFFGLLRLAVTGFMAYACINILSQYGILEEAVSASSAFVGEDEDLEPIIWNGVNLRAIAALATRQMSIDVSVPILGFNFSVWGLFIIFEIIRQILRVVSPEPAAPVAQSSGFGINQALALAGTFSGNPGLVSQYTKTFGQLHGIWQSLSEDVSAFVVLLGLAVGLSSLYVAKHQTVAGAGGEY
ncbi:UNVERIFIED_CONTAM: hypothetical protein HDU68_011196 [Siphonaria sp. JEL0065]|nr:hypothetical protein HDU68_011196 [Siphonaria sp. JEL0065]